MRRLLKYPLIIILIVLLVVLNLWRTSSKSKSGTTISAMTFNVGTRNSESRVPEKIHSTEQLANLIETIGIPEILLIEDAPWKIKMKVLAKLLGYSDFVSNRSRKFSSYGHLAIFSMFPLSSPESIPFHMNEKRAMALCAEASIEQKRLLLCAVHLSSIRFERRDRIGNILHVLQILRDETFIETEHSRDVKNLLTHIGKRKIDATIIGGDFNTFFFSKSIRAISNQFNDALWPSVDFFRGTYPKFPFFIKPRVDHLFHSENIDCLDSSIIRLILGDHYPIQATFRLPEKE